MNNLLLTNDYVNDILHQPEALRDTIAGFEGLNFDPFRQFAERLSTNALKRVVLTGMGSSFHALNPLRLTLIERGIQTEMFETSELIHFAPKLLSPETLVVAVSQSGQSVETLQLLDMAEKKVSLIGVTNTPDGALARRSDSVLLTRAGSEHTVSCKTYVATLAALAVLGDLLTGREARETIAALGAATDATAQYLSHWETYVDAAIQEMGGVHHLILAGRGTSLASAGTGGLIIKEAAHFHAEGMSCAAFRHGPLEMVSPAMFVLVFAGLGPSRQLNANLVVDIRNAGGRAELIAAEENNFIYSLPFVPDACLPLVEILPAQLTSIALAVLHKHIPGQFERGTKITEIA
jgi:glucosamine--fructose-6-phosphate aminotransferase (isomerizing)